MLADAVRDEFFKGLSKLRVKFWIENEDIFNGTSDDLVVRPVAPKTMVRL